MFLPAAVGRALTIARPLPWPGRCWREGGDVIAATFSQINIVNIITAPRSLAAHRLLITPSLTAAAVDWEQSRLQFQVQSSTLLLKQM